MKSLILINLLLVIALVAKATNIRPNTDGYYNTITTWSPNQSPVSGDAVVFDATANLVTQIILTEDETFNSLTSAINTGDGFTRSLTFIGEDPGTPHDLTLSSITFGSATEPVSLIIGSGVHLIVTGTTDITSSSITVLSGGSVTFNTLAIKQNSSITIESGATVTATTLTSSGGPSTLTVNGTLNVTNMNTGYQLNLVVNDGGVVNVTNSITYNNSTFTINTGGTFNASNNITIGGSFTGVIDGSMNIAGDININWGLAITGNGEITAGSYSNGGYIFGTQASSLIDGATYQSGPSGASATFYTRNSGAWNVSSNWSVFSCGGAAATTTPGSNDNIVICDGYTIALNGNTTIQNVDVEAGGYFDCSNRKLTIQGNLNVDGTFYSGNQDIGFTGSGKTISGIGIISLMQSATYKTLSIAGTNPTILAGTNLYIYGNVKILYTLTSYGTVEITQNLSGNWAYSKWINEENSDLRVAGTLLTTGILTASADNNTVEYMMDGDVDLKSSTTTYYNLVIAGSGIKKQKAALTIKGNFTISSGSYNPNNYNLNIQGDWTVLNDSYLQSTETVTFDGPGTQTLTNAVGETFYNLTINKTSGTFILANNIFVTNTLNLNEGIIVTGTKTLTLGSISSEGTLTHANDAVVVGNFKRYINKTNTGVSYLMPVGTVDYYRPLSVSFDNMTATGTCGGLLATFNESSPGTLNPIPTTDTSTTTSMYNTFIDGYWTLSTTDGLASTQFDLELTGTNFTSFTVDDNTRIFARTNSGTNWISDGTHDPILGETCQRLNMKTLPGEYCFVDGTNCTPPTTSSISGDTDLCINVSGEPYSVTNTSGSTYQWEIIPTDAGSIASGQGGNAITIDWGSTGHNAQIQVTETNTCTIGEPVTLDIITNPIAPASIQGSTSVPENEPGVSYTITDLGYTYTWLVTGGTIASGQNTSTILVNWGDAGSGTVEVYASNGCGLSDTTILDIDIYILILSIHSGNWSTPTNWDCNCEPTITDNVKILHDIISDKNNQACLNLDITSSGSLDASSWGFEVAGDILVNNTLIVGTGVNDKLVLSGSGTTIGGIGTITGDLTNNGGYKTILNSSLLTINGNFDNTLNAISIINYGHLTINGNLLGSDPSISWINEDYSHLLISGILLTTGKIEASSTGNIIEYTGNGQSIKTPNLNFYYNLVLSGSGTAYLNSDLEIGGSVTIENSASFSCGNSPTTPTTYFDLSVGENWINTSTGQFIEGTGTVTFNGTNEQSISCTSGETFYNMVTNKSSGLLTLSSNVLVSNALTMTQGNIDAGTYTLTLGSASEGTLNYTSGSIYATNGKFARYLSSAGNKLFPIGTSSSYRPAIVDINTIGSPGLLTLYFDEIDPGATDTINDVNTQVINQFTEGFWSITADASINISDYNLQLAATDFISYTLASPSRIIMRTNGGLWENPIPGIHRTAVSPNCYRDDITTFSLTNNTFEFGIGHTNCTPIDIPTITGETNVCAGEVETYSVPDHSPNTYDWYVANGTITADNGNSIDVTWDSDYSLDAKIKVIENTTCYSTDTSILSVTIHSLPTGTISGPTTVPSGYEIGTYTMSETRTGYTYTWTVPTGNGTPNPVTGTSTNVTWGTAGPATLRVSGQYNGCPAAPDKDLAVTVVNTIKTQNSGNWTNAGTWTGGLVPGAGEYAQILNTHTVNLNTSPTVAGLIIDNGGTLQDNGTTRNITITNSYYNYGTHITNGNVIFNNTTSNLTISGNGSLSLTNGTLQITISSFNNTITSTSDLIITGDINISNNVTLQNYGTITLNGSVVGGGASAQLINASGSRFNISGALLATGILYANSSDNTINYSGSNAQTIKHASSDNYYNLICSGSNTKTLGGIANINGDLTVSGTDVLDVSTSNYSILLAGNWTTTSSATDPFIERNGRVTFDGGSDQTISSGSETFHDLYIIKSTGGNVIFNSNITIANYLSLQKGIINNSAGSLTFTNGSSSNGGDPDSFVDGAITKIGNNAFTFPTGAGSIWARIGISAPTNSTTTFTAEYIYGTFGDTTLATTGEHLNRVSGVEYWNLDRPVGTSIADDVYITLYWEDSTRSGIGAAIYANDLRIGHYNTNLDPDAWESLPINISTGVSGSMTTVDKVGSFSPFAFASIGTGNPLPVELIDFNAYQSGNAVIVSWSTATETNNDYFTVQRSKNGVDFETVNIVAGAGNSYSIVNYGLTDYDPFNGTSYYRLKQTDYDGKSTYSDIVSVEFNKQKSLTTTSLLVYPNPYKNGKLFVKTTAIVVDEELLVEIYNLNGKMIYKQKYHNTEDLEFIISPETLEPLPEGIYLMKITTKQAVFNSRLIKE